MGAKPRSGLGHLLWRLYVGTATKFKRCVLTLGLQNGIKHLVVPALLTKQMVVNQAYFFRELARDMGRSKNQIPNKQHIAKVSFVVANAVFVGDGVVCPMGCRR